MRIKSSEQSLNRADWTPEDIHEETNTIPGRRAHWCTKSMTNFELIIVLIKKTAAKKQM